MQSVRMRNGGNGMSFRGPWTLERAKSSSPPALSFTDLYDSLVGFPALGRRQKCLVFGGVPVGAGQVARACGACFVANPQHHATPRVGDRPESSQIVAGDDIRQSCNTKKASSGRAGSRIAA